MVQQTNAKLTIQEIKELEECIYYLNLAELKDLSQQLGIPYGKKGELINRIIHFLTTGEITNAPKIPAASRAQRGATYPLHATALILYGSYKNDLVTRNFFKQLIGPHFHFTAFGIDWINDRWLSGNPPTYQEFAHYWQQENERRKNSPINTKTEWAYIHFIQRFVTQYPQASAAKVRIAWHKERTEKVAHAYTIFKKLHLT